MSDYTGPKAINLGEELKKAAEMQHENRVPLMPATQIGLRQAAAEALKAGALVLAAMKRAPNWAAERITKESEERFRKALEELARALG